MKITVSLVTASAAAVLASANTKEEAAPKRAMIRGFVQKPKLDFPGQLRQFQTEVSKGKVAAHVNKGKGSGDSCIPLPTDSAYSSDRSCERYCSSEDFESHAYADLITSLSIDNDEECLCFNGPLENLSIPSKPSVSDFTFCTSISAPSRDGAKKGASFVKKSKGSGDSCIPLPTDSAYSSDRKCERYCSSEDFENHAYADLITSLSIDNDEECLCFNGPLANITIPSNPSVSDFTFCTSISAPSSDGAKKGASLVKRSRKKSGSGDSCIPLPTDSAYSSDRKCERYCSSEDFENHAYADLITSLSIDNDEECLCFDGPLANITIPSNPSVSDFTFCTSISGPSRDGVKKVA